MKVSPAIPAIRQSNLGRTIQSGDFSFFIIIACKNMCGLPNHKIKMKQ